MILEVAGFVNTKLKLQVKHLGIEQGIDVSSAACFDAVFAKAELRLQVWMSYQAWGRNVMSFIWRTYILSLFMYVARFYSPGDDKVGSKLTALRASTAGWRRGGGPTVLSYADWLFGLPDHFVDGTLACRATLLRTASLYAGERQINPAQVKACRQGWIRAHLHHAKELLKKQAGVSLAAVVGRWQGLQHGKIRRQRDLPEWREPDWVGDAPARARRRWYGAADGSCRLQTDGWGRTGRLGCSPWAAVLYKGELRHWLQSGLTNADPSSELWSGLFKDNAGSGELQGLIETLKKLLTIGHHQTPHHAREAVVGGDNQTAVGVALGTRRSHSEPVADWILWLLMQELKHQRWDIWVRWVRGHAGSPLNTEVAYFAGLHLDRKVAGTDKPPLLWLGRARDRCEEGEVRPEQLEEDYEHPIPEAEAALADAAGARRPGLMGMFYSLMRALPWIPAGMPIRGDRKLRSANHVDYCNHRGRDTIGWYMDGKERRQWYADLKRQVRPATLWAVVDFSVNVALTPRRRWTISGKTGSRPLCSYVGKVWTTGRTTRLAR